MARSLGGILVTPPVDPDYIRRYFGELKGFPKIDERITIVSGGVPVIAPPSQADLESALRYGNHRSAEEHLPLIWKKIGEDVRRQKCLVIKKSAAHEIPNVRVLPLGAVVTHKVRVINDLSFDLFNRAKKGGLNAETDVNSVPPSLCAEALPEFLTELVSLRAENPKLRLFMATTDVNDAYRNVRIDPNQAHNFCYTVGDLVVIDFRLTFGWTGSPANFGVMASAVENSHRNNDLSNVQLLPEGVKMMEQVEIVDRWEVGDPTPVPPDAKIRASKGGKLSSPFHTVVYVDDHGLIRAQQSDEDKSALVVSASLARGQISFSRVGLARIGLRTTFWAGRAGRDTHPSAKKELELEHNLRVLRFRYQLTHARNFSNDKKSTSDTDGTGRRLASLQAPSDSAGGVQYCRQAVESDVRSTSRKVFRLEAPENH